MTDGLGVPGKLKEQGETLVGHGGILRHHTVGVLLFMEDVLQETLRDQRQFQVAAVAGVIVDDIVHDVIGIEILVLTLRVHAQGNSSRHPDGLFIGHVAIFVKSRLCVVAVLQAELDLIGIAHGVLLSHNKSRLFRRSVHKALHTSFLPRSRLQTCGRKAHKRKAQPPPSVPAPGPLSLCTPRCPDG